MNGAQDMGGVDGFGPVRPEVDEPVFHAEWERRAFALTLAMATPGGWNIDMSRFARENRSPASYLSKSYYQIWLAGLEQLMAERGLVSREEIESGRVTLPPRTDVRVLVPENVAAVLRKGGPTERDATTMSLFAVGDRVRAKNIQREGHTRLPRYVRGHVGVIDRLHGAHVFPDSNAHGEGEHPQWLYTVRFTGRELWGERADATSSVSVDAWESYLERAE
jgi:nitrile hydratase